MSPMMNTLSKYPDDLEDLLNTAIDNNLRSEDPAWEAIDVRRVEQRLKEDFDRQLTEIAGKVEELNESFAKERRLFTAESNKLKKALKRKSGVAQNTSRHLPIVAGTFIGAIISGAIAHFYIIPNSLASERIHDSKLMKFLKTEKGKAFTRVIELDGEYFPEKCLKQAKDQGVFLLVNGKKINQVCVLRTQ
jgi:hypothetical protein